MDFKTLGSKIVIADDSKTVVRKLDMFLTNQGYEVFVAFDGAQCLQLINAIEPDLIILDLDMPIMNGVEVCRAVKGNEKTSLIPVIILTGSGTHEDKNMAISVGANDYLYKTFDILELKLKVESLLKLKHAIDQLENSNNILKALVKAVELKDKYTVGHAERVSLYAKKVGKALDFTAEQLRDIEMAGLLHDIGKIGVPDAILNKAGRLTEEEFNIIKRHPAAGVEVCQTIKSFENVNNIIRSHHEKLNGNGYPDGLIGKEINIETRIMTIADIYDALTSDRSYRKSMSQDKAFEILKESALKGDLDLSLTEIFESVIRG